MSPMLKFLLVAIHFCFSWRLARNSFLQGLQNSLLICGTIFHLRLQYKSGPPNTPGGSITNFLYFIVRMWLGESATSLFTLIVSTVSDFEVMVSSTSTNKVAKDSSFRLASWVFIIGKSMILADRMCLFHTPPMWLTIGIFFYTQYNLYSFLEGIHWSFAGLFCQLPLCSNKVATIVTVNCLYFPRLTIKLRSAKMKESVFIPLVIPIWMTRPVKQVSRAP